MTFLEALSAVFDDGERVTRAHWNNRNIYLVLENAKLCIVGGLNLETLKPDRDNKPHPYIVDENDYYASDWEAVDD